MPEFFGQTSVFHFWATSSRDHGLMIAMRSASCEKVDQSTRCEKKKDAKKKTWILPWNLTWNLNMEVWKMIFLFSWVLFRFHVKFQGCRFRCHNFSTDLNRFRSWSWKIWNMFLYDPSLHGTWFFSSISRETMAKVAKLCKHTTSSA